MKRLNIINSIACKYPSILTGLIFITTSVLPLATPAMAGASDPVLTVDKNITITGVLPVGGDAIYQVTIKNTSVNKAYNVKITDVLPSGFKYAKELTMLTKGAVVPTATKIYIKPVSGNTTPTWDNFEIPGNGIVSLFFTANTSAAALGKFSNSVSVNYKNSSGVAQPVAQDTGGGTVDDVVIKAVPPQPKLGIATRSAAAVGNTPITFCGGKPGADGIATDITGIVNTYFRPSLQSVAAGSTSGIDIMAGAAKGINKDIQPGDLLLIVQIQDASINTTTDASGTVTVPNSDAYGSGSSANQGSGQLSMGTTGLYEYATADSVVTYASGGSKLMLKKPLINSYISSAPTATSGQKRFQVIRVPQYASVTVKGTLYASPWDGNVGGVLAVDTFGKFNLNNQRMSANSTGFRGGYGPQNGYKNANSDYVNNYSSTPGSGKGEGTAGTPRFISTQSEGLVDPATGAPTWNGGSTDNGIEGYPGGSTGRGAPANAGGGGNAHNSGGGGGGNGGIGGQGGLSWSNGTNFVPFDSGGRPGYLSSTYNLVPWQLIMGGGGGGGEANDSPQGVPGGAGGGIVMLRAGTIVGSGQIFANGRDGDRGAYGGNPDGAGGAGAGGTVLIQSRNATTASLNIQANGGSGGSTERDAFYNYRTAPVSLGSQNAGENVGYTADGYPFSHTPHGPGGGGAGGVILYNFPGGTVTTSVTGGSAGHTDDPATDPTYTAVSGKTSNPHGATAGSDGVVIPFSNSEDPFNSLNNVTDCSPNLTLTYTPVTPVVRQSDFAKFKIIVTNTGKIGGAAEVTIDTQLPAGFVYYKTDSIVLNSGTSPATRPLATASDDPAAKSTTPTWGKFTIPPGGVVEINYQVLVSSTVPVGTSKQTIVRTSYPDPLRDAANPNAKIVVFPPDGKNSIEVKKGQSETVWNLSPTIRIVSK